MLHVFTSRICGRGRGHEIPIVRRNTRAQGQGKEITGLIPEQAYERE
jgi:hypothetical protein